MEEGLEVDIERGELQIFSNAETIIRKGFLEWVRLPWGKVYVEWDLLTDKTTYCLKNKCEVPAGQARVAGLRGGLIAYACPICKEISVGVPRKITNEFRVVKDG